MRFPRIAASFALLMGSLPASAQRATIAPPEVIPSQVKYVGADAMIVADARARLERSFGKKELWLELLDGKNDTDEPILIGQFLSETFGQVPGFDAAKFVDTKTTAQIGDLSVNMHGIGLRTREQKRAIAPYLAALTNVEPAAHLRRFTAAEMALIWPFIGWDLSEPLFVIETGGERIAAEFTPDGRRIKWIERLSNLCFLLAQNGQSLTSCICARVNTDGAEYELVFRKNDDTERCTSQGAQEVKATDHGP